MNLLLQAIHIFCTVLQYALIIGIILSWIPGARQSVLGEVVDNLTRPILNPLRKLINNSPLGGSGMMFDFSYMIAYVILEFIKSSVR